MFFIYLFIVMFPAPGSWLIHAHFFLSFSCLSLSPPLISYSLTCFVEDTVGLLPTLPCQILLCAFSGLTWITQTSASDSDLPLAWSLIGLENPFLCIGFLLFDLFCIIDIGFRSCVSIGRSDGVQILASPVLSIVSNHSQFLPIHLHQQAIRKPPFHLSQSPFLSVPPLRWSVHLQDYIFSLYLFLPSWNWQLPLLIWVLDTDCICSPPPDHPSAPRSAFSPA